MSECRKKLHGYLAHHHITWQFNLSRAPWWGGEFERMIGLVKQALHKFIGGAHLTWVELEEVILDIEVTLNNHPLTYVEDHIQLPVLTPNTMIFSQPNLLPEDDVDLMEDGEMCKIYLEL